MAALSDDALDQLARDAVDASVYTRVLELAAHALDYQEEGDKPRLTAAGAIATGITRVAKRLGMPREWAQGCYDRHEARNPRLFDTDTEVSS